MTGSRELWMARGRRLLRWARLIFTPLSLLVIAWFIWQARPSLGAALRDGTPGLLLAALLLWIASNLLSPWVSVHLLRICRIDLPYGAALGIHCSRLPAKYLPGGIWHSVGRASDYLARGNDGRKVGTYFLLENILLIAVTFGLGGMVAGSLILVPGLDRLIQIFAAVALAFMVALPFLPRIASWTPVIPLAPYALVVLMLACYWVLVGIAFATFIHAFPGLGIANPPMEVVGIYVFSWSLGYLAVFAPQGIGVSEFVAGNLLGGIEVGQVLALLLGFRALVLIGDLLCWAGAAAFRFAAGTRRAPP